MKFFIWASEVPAVTITIISNVMVIAVIIQCVLLSACGFRYSWWQSMAESSCSFAMVGLHVCLLPHIDCSTILEGNAKLAFGSDRQSETAELEPKAICMLVLQVNQLHHSTGPQIGLSLSLTFICP